MNKFFFVLFFCCFCYVQTARQLNKTSLYSNFNIPIIEENPENFRSLINNKPYGILIQFYVSWCGHCQSFAPIFANFSKQIVNWKNVLQLMVINCADDFNKNLCSDYKIIYYPTILFIKPNSRRRIKPQLVETNKTIDGLFNTTINLLTNLNKTKLQFENPNWPKIKFLNQNETSRVFYYLKNQNPNHKTLAYLHNIETQEVIKSILNFSNYIKELTIFYLNCSSDEFAKKYLSTEIKDFPVLVEVNGNESLTLVKTKASYDEFNEFIIENYLIKIWVSYDSDFFFKKKLISENFKIDHKFQVYTRDLNNALRYTFMNEIVRFNQLKPEQVQTLVTFTSVLNKYFPYDNENTKRFLRRISQWFKDRKPNESLKLENVKAIFKAGAEGYLPTTQPYISCKGSIPLYREYPCALWLLFHTLTVQEYWYNFNMSKKDPIYLDDPIEKQVVIFNMRDYIKNFFSCQVCREHFLNMSSNLENEITYLNSSFLWLWKNHNKVNLRLHNEKNEDPKFPKQMFPSYLTCPTCYIRKPFTTNPIEDDFNLYPWNVSEVENYLLSYYDKKNILVKNSSVLLLINKFILVICTLFFIFKFLNKF